jgi:hypothetical protein
MGELGTKAKFRSWLQSKHGITYTAYTKLELEARASIHAEYKKVKKS